MLSQLTDTVASPMDRWRRSNRKVHPTLEVDTKMNRTQELISALATEEVIARTAIAKAHGICKICGEPAIHFQSPRAALEYHISSICQACQDYYFQVEQ